MVVSRRFEAPDLVVITLRGIVTSRDQADVVDWVRMAIRRAGAVRLLITLEMFGGWRADASFEDATLWLTDDERVSKIAIAGALQWKAPIFTLIAQPLRRISIKYFEAEAAARRWLNGDASTSMHAAVKPPRRRRPADSRTP